MDMRKAFVATIVLSIAATAGGALLYRHFDTSQSLGDGPMTSIAPSINFVTLEGKTLSLASLKGRWVLINFWASWCAPCIDELPNLVRAQDEYSGLGLQIERKSVVEGKSGAERVDLGGGRSIKKKNKN